MSLLNCIHLFVVLDATARSVWEHCVCCVGCHCEICLGVLFVVLDATARSVWEHCLLCWMPLRGLFGSTVPPEGNSRVGYVI